VDKQYLTDDKKVTVRVSQHQLWSRFSTSLACLPVNNKFTLTVCADITQSVGTSNIVSSMHDAM